MDALSKITGGNNGMLFIDSAQTDKNFFALVVNADCVLTTLTGGNDENLLTAYGLSGKTLKQGMIIVGNGYNIKAVTPSSGSLLGYNDNQNPTL